MKNSLTKKLLSVILAVTMVFGALPVLTVPTFAADKATVTLESATVSPGETFELKLTIKDNPGMDNLMVRLTYDKTVFSLDSVKNGDVFPEDEYGTFDSELNQMWIYANPDESLITADGVLCTYTFKVSEEASGDYEIKVIFPFDDGKATAVNSTVTVTGKTVTGKTVTDISIGSLPVKTTYTTSDTLDTTGLVLNVAYSDGSTKSVTSGFTCSPVNFDTVGTQTVTVIYKEKTAIFDVTVDNARVSFDDLTFKLNSNGDGYVISNCNTSAIGELVIPSEYNGLPVTAIGYQAFSYCRKITSVTIPDSVTSIGGHAFYDCINLTSVTIPDSVTEISYNAFSYCTSLVSVTIPDSVTEIGYDAFEGCTSLTSVTIPDSVTYIGSSAFSGCTSLVSITIPDSVTEIRDYAFSGCTSLTFVTISDSVTSIGYEAFFNCTSLTSVTIPDSVTYIGSSAFSGCTSLVSITIPDSVTEIRDYAFSGCTSLTFVTISDSVTTIDSYSFYDCENLESVIFSYGLSSIGYYSFRKCDKLKSVTIPSSVTYIGDEALGYDAFGDLVEDFVINGYTYTEAEDYALENNIEFVSLGEEPLRYTLNYSKDGYEVTGCSSRYEGELVIPSEYNGLPVTEIDSGAFEDCTKLTSITIPESVTYIGWHAFGYKDNYYDEALDKWIYPKIEGFVINGYTYSEAHDYAVENDITFNSIGTCDPLRYELNEDGKSYSIKDISDACEFGDYTIPSEYNGLPVTGIGNYAFYGCKSLTSVTIPDSVTEIGSYAFSGCARLKNITIPTSLTQINQGAFSKCTNLSSVIIPNNIVRIENQAFRDCPNLVSVTIPETVTYIGEHAFGYISENNSEGGMARGGGRYGFGVLKNFEINGYDYSIAHDYAIENEFTFNSIGTLDKSKVEPLSFKLNEDGVSYTIETAKPSCVVGSFTVPSEHNGLPVTKIENIAFAFCKNLCEITIPQSIESVGANSLGYVWDYTGESYIEVFYITKKPDFIINGYTYSTAHDYSVGHEITFNSIGDAVISDDDMMTFELSEDGNSYALEKCKPSYAIDNFAILMQYNGVPVTRISRYAFNDCKLLKTVVIPESVSSIDEAAFLDCTALTHIIIPSSVTEIGSYAIGYKNYDGWYWGKIEGFTIYGYKGSAAEEYANENEFEFVAITKAADESTGITVEGQIPENTVLSVEQLETVDNKVTFDITLTNNGTAVQPEGTVLVKIPVPAGLDGEECNVYRKEENGTYTDMEAVFDGTNLIFTTDHFSEYVVTTENLSLMYGDVNGDGVLTPSDVVLLRRYFANYDSETETSTIEVSAGADVNGDGVLTPSDVVLLRRYFANYDSETDTSTIVLGK